MISSSTKSPVSVLSIVAYLSLMVLFSSVITSAFHCSNPSLLTTTNARTSSSSVSLPSGAPRLYHNHKHHLRSGCQHEKQLHLQNDDHGDVMESSWSSTTTTNRRTAIGNTLRIASILLTTTSSATIASAAELNKSLSEEYRQGTAALGNTDADETIPRSSYITLPSGVIYADIATGNGESVKEGSTVNLQWVLRRSNGYFVDSSAVSDSIPFIFKVGSGNAIVGLDEGVRGMKVGGSRRILIPPKLAYVTGVEDGKPGPLPVGFGPKRQITRVMEVRKDVPGEYFYLEVKVTKVR